jgi:hypothetical protein
MKKTIALLLLAFASVAHADCTRQMRIEAPQGSTLVKLDIEASKKVFAAATTAEIGGTMDLQTSMWLNTISSQKMVCCKFSSARALVLNSERCVIAVATDGSLADVDYSVLK